MLRGIHKNIISIQPPQSKYFESVWFVLRPDYRRENGRDRDMVREAGRILAEGEKGMAPPKGMARRPSGRLLFWVGLGGGGAAASLLWFLVLLFR